jgi:hypothetical protein
MNRHVVTLNRKIKLVLIIPPKQSIQMPGASANQAQPAGLKTPPFHQLATPILGGGGTVSRILSMNV